MSRPRVFLLSPANLSGRRSALLWKGEFDLAKRLRQGEATLGEVFGFISGLYFRGKLAYVEAFASPPAGAPGAMIMTAGRGLLRPETVIRAAELEQMACVPVDCENPEYRIPLERDCRALLDRAGGECDFVLLGSVSTPKYLEPLFDIFGSRLLFPEEFIGRGDLSRGGLMLRSARAGQLLTHVPVGGATRHGSRPPRLARLKSGSNG